MYFVSRQCYWPDGQNAVEVVTVGIDNAGPDMLTAKYLGEGGLYANPREAIEVAMIIADQWQWDMGKDFLIEIVAGNTWGGSICLAGQDMSVTELKAWAEREYKSLPTCEWCEEIIVNERWSNDYGYSCCSEYCAEESYSALRKAEVDDYLDGLNRDEVVEILEGLGIACYDDESTKLLKDCLRESIESGDWEI
jgi:hypothetical protein